MRACVQAERPITSVGWVRFMTDPSDFQIYFKDSLEEIVTDYTAESPYECGACVRAVDEGGCVADVVSRRAVCSLAEHGSDDCFLV